MKIHNNTVKVDSVMMTTTFRERIRRVIIHELSG